MTSRSQLIIGFAIILALVVLNRAVWFNGPAPAYVVAARLLQAHQFDTRVYDDAWYKLQTLALTQGAVSDIFAPSPPTLGLFLWPLIWVSPLIWTILNFGVLWLAIALSFHALTTTSIIRWTFVAVLSGALLSTLLYENMARGQIYLFMALLHALVFWGMMRARDGVAGVALGLMFAWKLHAWPLWVIVLALRRWRVMIWGIVTLGVCVTLTLPLMGADIWRVYLQQVLLARAADPSATVTAYQTLNSFFQHLFRYDAEWNPAPLWNAPWLALPLWVFSSAVLLGITLWRGRVVPLARTLGASSPLCMILAPLAEQYHFLILLVPCVVLVLAWSALSPRSRLTLLLALGLLIMPLPFQHPALRDGWLALFAYPRLYGAGLLWSLFIFSSPSLRISLPAEH
jgi:hypothetical protein